MTPVQSLIRSVSGNEGGHQHERRLDGLGGEGEVLPEPHLVETDRVGAADDVHVLVEEGVVPATDSRGSGA